MAKQKKGSKGKGTHAAKKAKYQAHKAGSSKKGKNKKQTGGTITMKNKATRAVRHQKNCAKKQILSERRLDMLEQVKSKFSGMKQSELFRKFGTLNIRRMTDILDDTYQDAEWFLARAARRKANAEAKRKVGRKHVKFHKRKRDKDRSAGAVRKVHGGRNKRDRKVQVDSE